MRSIIASKSKLANFMRLINLELSDKFYSVRFSSNLISNNLRRIKFQKF